MDNDSRFHIITGPNMGGKSTYIRSIASIVFLAHLGCFVPAQNAKIPITDAIITRVGASDMQLRGISTFMSEMQEASCMIKVATPKSLVIIDELGRGTSTSEGFGIAWAISQYLVEKKGCFTFFATHFHELTKMSEQLQGVQNYYMTCITKSGELEMTYIVKQGVAERSYGLYVAELLKFPQQIIQVATSKLLELESLNENLPQLENNINYSHDYYGDDIQQLSKFSNFLQREKVLCVTLQYKKQIQKSFNQQDKIKLCEELKEKIKSILQGKM